MEQYGGKDPKEKVVVHNGSVRRQRGGILITNQSNERKKN
jgi:hypothetical protein